MPPLFSHSALRPLGNPAHMHTRIKLATRLRLSNSSCRISASVLLSPAPLPGLLRLCAVNCQCATMRCSFCFIFYAASHFDFADFVCGCCRPVSDMNYFCIFAAYAVADNDGDRDRDADRYRDGRWEWRWEWGQAMR